jgi:hypothetical protein
MGIAEAAPTRVGRDWPWLDYLGLVRDQRAACAEFQYSWARSLEIMQLYTNPRAAENCEFR